MDWGIQDWGIQDMEALRDMLGVWHHIELTIIAK
jgi:hypothetical protein